MGPPGVLTMACGAPTHRSEPEKEPGLAATTIVSDYVIWVKQVQGDARIAEQILDLQPGHTIDLLVDGVRGVWRKMDDGKDGRPTRGIRPLGRTHEFWRTLYQSRRGDVVTLELPQDAEGAPRPRIAISPPLGRTPEERDAALEALLELGRQGWRSDAPYGSRDELYDRS